MVDYEQEDYLEDPLENPCSYGQEREEKNPIMLGKKVPSVKSNIEYKVKRSDPWKEAIVISRVGKATGKNKYWMNIKDLEDGTFKSINFDKIDQWRLKGEVILLAYNNHSTIEAKHLELQNWRYHKVYTEVEDEDQLYLSVRWVKTVKHRDGEQLTKARLVARGFEEEHIEKLKTGSPPCCKKNLRVLFAIIASNHWKIRTLDIKTAFFQGQKVDREIYLKPPIEAGTDKLWKLQTTVYGLNDAARAWYLRVKEESIKVKAVMSKFDEAVFFWRVDCKLHGILACHVDDFILGVSDLFEEKVINKQKEKFLISQEENQAFNYIGLEVKQTDQEISIQQKKYISELSTIAISDVKDKLQPLNIKKTRFKGFSRSAKLDK